ncbi:MAG TPA: hypothetical protein VGJ21_18460 [Terracidiphilus sp.]|jgi:predicted histidine transporter YuiF (NhaC family)
MKMPWTNLHGAAKVVAICAMVFLVAAGLCGMEGAILSVGRLTDSVASIFIVLGGIAAMAIVVSVLVGFVALLVWGFGSMFRRDPK